MRMSLMLAAAAAAALAAGAASAASVEVKDAVARVTVIPEARTDIKVDIIQANPQLPLEVRTFAGRTIVDGRLGRRVRECRGSGENVSVHVRGVGDVAWRGHRGTAVALDPGDAGVDRLLGHVVDGDLGAVLRQGEGDAAANVRPAAGDQRDLALQGYVQRPTPFLTRSCLGGPVLRAQWLRPSG